MDLCLALRGEISALKNVSFRGRKRFTLVIVTWAPPCAFPVSRLAPGDVKFFTAFIHWLELRNRLRFRVLTEVSRVTFLDRRNCGAERRIGLRL